MVMTKDAGWKPPRRKPITKETIDRAIAVEAERATNEHRARAAWYDRTHDAVILLLSDGRVFGAERTRIPSLAEANPRQFRTLQVTEDGAFLWMPPFDLQISVDGLVTRLMESSPATLRRSAARSTGATTSPAKADAARRNGRLGGRPRKAA
jgi:hypothetical protein